MQHWVVKGLKSPNSFAFNLKEVAGRIWVCFVRAQAFVLLTKQVDKFLLKVMHGNNRTVVHQQVSSVFIVDFKQAYTYRENYTSGILKKWKPWEWTYFW